MKKAYFFCCIVVLAFQSCLKVDELGVVCMPALPTPILATQQDTVIITQGQYFSTSISNRPTTLGFLYTWTGPGNYTTSNANGNFSFQALSATQSGTYAVSCRNTASGCISEETSIVVIVDVPANSCFMSNNTFTLGGASPVYTFPVANIILNGSYFFARWETTTGQITTVRFGAKPGTLPGVYNVLDVSDPQLLGDDESEITCTIGGAGYTAISGLVKTSYANGKYKAEFCNILLKKVGTSTYSSNCKGNLTFQ